MLIPFPLYRQVMPVWYPGGILYEDGCVVIPVGEKGLYSVISGDGTIVFPVTDPRKPVAAEFKTTVPGKKFTTDTYYKPYLKYSTQVRKTSSFYPGTPPPITVYCIMIYVY